VPGRQHDAVATVFDDSLDDSLDVLTHAGHCEEPAYAAVTGDVTGLDMLDIGAGAGAGVWTRRI
jgi:toxoflavin synthase